MKIRNPILILALLFLAVVAVFGQDTNGVPGGGLPELPGDKTAFWKYAIAAVTPVIVTIIKFFAEKTPKWLLPTMTPLIGLALGWALKSLGAANLGWMDMAEAGALAVFIREVVNQAITKRLAEET